MQPLNYPQSIIEFQQWFPNEEACEKYLFKVRWPKGFVCPICGDREAYYISSRRVFQCKSKKHQTYLTADTVMQGTRTPLLIWFWSAYLLTTETPGISSIQLQRQLKINRHETAFNILHKLRASMVNPFRDKIGPKNAIEVDETYIGGPTTGGKRGRGTQKAIVVVAVEVKKTADGKRMAGRLRLRHVKNASEKSLSLFIQDSINKGSTIITDAFKSYQNLGSYGYKHKVVIQKLTDKESSLYMAHIVISNLKTWLKGTFHGVSDKHLQAYLNEYVFRFNRRFYPMAGFQTLLGLSSKVAYPTYKGLYSGTYTHPNPKKEA